jgi:Flp pilus assembly protein TadG
MLRPRTQLHDQDGVAALEFALVLPVLMALVFGIIAYGTMLSFRQTLSQAAAEGARQAAVAPPGLPDADRETRARNAIAAALGSQAVCDTGGMRCTVTIDQACGVRACAIVRLEHDYAANPVVPAFGLPLPTTLVYEAVAEVS